MTEPDDRPVGRLIAQLALVAAADAALVGWWGQNYAWLSFTGPRPILFALFAMAIGRRPPFQLLLAGLALLASGATARWLIGEPATVTVFVLGTASLVLVLGFAIARLDWRVWRVLAGLALITAALRLPLDEWAARALVPSGPSVAVLSSLPLGVSATPEGGRLMLALEQRGSVTLLDSVPSGGPATERLLMIQPRALTGEEMVALDGWVRRGGRAAVLDDPQLDWPSEGPLGAPGGPLGTSLLDPLMTHWGVRLELPASGRAVPKTVALNGGTLILPSPGFYTRLSPACTLLLNGRAARCAVGEGQVLMIADADWVDPRRWWDQPRTPEVLGQAIATGEFRPQLRNGSALWLGLVLLLVGVIAAVIERKRNSTRSEEKQTV